MSKDPAEDRLQAIGAFQPRLHSVHNQLIGHHQPALPIAPYGPQPPTFQTGHP
jgi:hypothetical protein